MATSDKRNDQKKWNPGTKPEEKKRPPQPPPGASKPKEFGPEKRPRPYKAPGDDDDTSRVPPRNRAPEDEE